MAANYSHTGIWLVLGILILRVLIKAPHLFNAWWASALLTGIPVCVNQKQIWPSLPPSVENSHPLSEDGDLLGRRNKTKVAIQVETSFQDFHRKVIFGEPLLCCLVYWSLGLSYTSLEYGAPYMPLVEGWLNIHWTNSFKVAIEKKGTRGPRIWLVIPFPVWKGNIAKDTTDPGVDYFDQWFWFGRFG